MTLEPPIRASFIFIFMEIDKNESGKSKFKFRVRHLTGDQLTYAPISYHIIHQVRKIGVAIDTSDAANVDAL